VLDPRSDLDGPSIPVRVDPIRLPEPAQAPVEEPAETTPPAERPVEEPVPS
jgi:hypothetical protein